MLVTGDCRSNFDILRPLAISESLPMECLQFLASSKLWLNCEHRCEEVEKFAKRAISRIVVVVRGYQCSNLHVIDATKKLFFLWVLPRPSCCLLSCLAKLCFHAKQRKTWCKAAISLLI